jgi:hypothetical protein
MQVAGGTLAESPLKLILDPVYKFGRDKFFIHVPYIRYFNMEFNEFVVGFWFPCT